jgi:hypothetical protein
MAATPAELAGARLASVYHGETQIEGAIGGQLAKRVRRDPRRADGQTDPYARPIIERDAEGVVRFVQQDQAILDDAAPANLKFNYTTGEIPEGTGYVEMGPFVAGDVVHEFEQRAGGFPIQQSFELRGALLYNITL